jgi:hypothetical protein
MPDRILRDEILDSERWLAVDCGAKLAFVACLLKCDAVGNLDAQPLRLYRLWRDFGAGTVEASEELLKALEAVDLVREYLVDHRRFIHIPRFGQRVRYVGSLHPGSPWDKTGKQQKQSAAEISPGDSQAQVGSESGDSQALTGCAPAEVKRSEVKRSEVNLKHGLPTPTDSRARAPDPETEKPKTVLNNNFQTEKPKTDPDLPREWWRDDAKTDTAGRALATPSKPGESYADYRARLFEVIAHRKRGTDPAKPARTTPRQPPEAILQNLLDVAKAQQGRH